MNIILRVLLGAAIAIAGYFIVWKSEMVTGWVGRSWWAEWNLQSFGGTSGLIKIIGIVIMLIGFVTLTGGGDDILRGIAGIFVPGI